MVNHRPLMVAGIALGIGLGGFVDGILFHQLLQLHNMLSARLPTRDLPAEELVINLETNMFWDGLFHLLTWTMTLLGIVLLWNVAKRERAMLSDWLFYGSMLMGWGVFNLVEGVIDHHLLHLHHVTETADHLKWDIIFLASGVLLVAIGWSMVRLGKGATTADVK